MIEMFQLPFMVQALIACLLLTLVLSYFGVHVVSRGIVFIDLALAQISSAGVAFALLIDADPRLWALVFTLGGSLMMAFLPKTSRVPQEAIIGIIYAAASAAAILMLSKTMHADADVTTILFGNILAVSPQQILEMAVIFAIVGLFHGIFHRQFNALSGLTADGEPKALSSFSLWNTLFYLTLALVIAEAIRAAGVLLVFSYLIVPAVSALLLFRKPWPVLIFALALGILTSVLGLYSSFTYDLPTGAAIVGCFGILFFIILLASQWRQRKSRRK
jgi:zinc/manganese transport system permease protein